MPKINSVPYAGVKMRPWKIVKKYSPRWFGIVLRSESALMSSGRTSTVARVWLKSVLWFGTAVNSIQTLWYMLLWHFKLRHPIFIHWVDWVGKSDTATELATDFHIVTGRWADEFSDYNPDPKREAFYISAALQLGDPRVGQWMQNKGARFRKFFCEYHNLPYPSDGGAEAMIQYILWYERDGPKLDINAQSHTE